MLCSKSYILYSHLMNIVNSFRINARAELSRQKKTQADVARSTGMTLKAVHRLCNPALATRLDFSNAIYLADFLHVSIDSLIDRDSTYTLKAAQTKALIDKHAAELTKLRCTREILSKDLIEALKKV